MTTENGITNIEIEKFFDNEMNDDLKRNFVGVYLSDSITKYINFYNIIKEKIAKYPFAIFNTDRKNNQERIGGAFLIFIEKKIFYYLKVLDSLALSSLLQIMIKI